MDIKFRAWKKYQKKMCEVLQIDFTNKKVYIEKNQKGIPFGYLRFDDVILMQSSGQTDKNGVEIYAGDIVIVFNSGERTVVRQNGAFGYLTDFGHFVSFAGNYNFQWQDEKSMRIEVVGNVYENPEMLEVVE